MNLKEKRIQKGMTQQEVADAVGIAKPTYCNIEQGKRSMRVRTAKKIARTLDFDWTELYEEEKKEA